MKVIFFFLSNLKQIDETEFYKIWLQFSSELFTVFLSPLNLSLSFSLTFILAQVGGGVHLHVCHCRMCIRVQMFS